MATTTTSLIDDAATLRELKQAAAELESQAKAAKADAQRVELEFFARADEEGVESLKYDGTLFVPTETVYGQIQDRAAFVEWAQNNNPELLELKERKSLVNELIRAHLDDGAELPDGCGFYVKQYVSQRVG